eukprot:5746594-Amphidinium_carterae.4
MVAGLATYAWHGIPTSQPKEEVREMVVKALGNCMDGRRAVVCCPTEPLMVTWLLVREIVNKKRASRHEVHVDR